MWRIKKSLLLDAINSAQRYMPTEFICFLGGDRKKEYVEEIVFLPSNTSETSASIDEYSMPIDDTIIGSLHSHPFSTNHPSRQDKKFFSKYPLNLVLGYPYSIESIGFYDQKGEKVIVLLE
ncbi:putative metalloprotease [uncultured archaeon]|nr:putative metalloprotease [uncultured archaeon]